MTDGERLNRENEVDVLSSLLVRLPVTSPSEVEPSLTGLLLPSSRGRVRLVIGDQVLEFSQQDIVSARLCEGDDILVGTVELTLLEGARVLGVYPARPFREFLRGRRPFAFSARDETAARSTSSARYDELEHDYLTRRGLLPDP